LSKVLEYLIDFQGKSVHTVRYRRQVEVQCQISRAVTLECDRQVQITIRPVRDAHDSLNPGRHQGNATGVLNGVMRESQWSDIEVAEEHARSHVNFRVVGVAFCVLATTARVRGIMKSQGQSIRTGAQLSLVEVHRVVAPF